MPSSPPLTSNTTANNTTANNTTAYSLEGTVLDASHGGRVGPGPSGAHPASRSVGALIVEHGVVAGIDVSGVVVLTVSERRFPAGPLRRLALLDERATPQQVRAVLDLVQGRLGGTLAVFALPVDEELGVYQVPVEWELGTDRVVVRAPGHLELVVLADSSTMAVDIPEYDLVWRVESGDTLRGEIHVAGGVVVEQ